VILGQVKRPAPNTLTEKVPVFFAVDYVVIGFVVQTKKGA
jgi:hypothetical protein